MFEDSILFKKLEERSPKKAELVKKVYKEFKDDIESIKNLFPEFTEHGVRHCKSIVEILEKYIIDNLYCAKWDNDKLVISDNVFLTVEEITLLLLGIILHDIGMSPNVNYKQNKKAKEILEKLNSETNENKRRRLKKKLDKLKDEIREKHNEISASFVKKDRRLDELMKKYEFKSYKDFLAFIVEAHRYDPIDIFRNYDPTVFEKYNVREPIVAFLLELADDMDIGYWRVDTKRFEELVQFLRGKNIEHAILNKSVKRIEKTKIVRYDIEIPSAEEIGEESYKSILTMLLNWFEKINVRIDRAKIYGGQILGKWKDILPPKVEFDIYYKVDRKVANVDLSMRFEVDRRVFADLLSDKIYEGKWVYAFRELISNAFDAIKRRAYEDKKFNDPHVNVEIEFKGDWTEIVVEDNGIGMSMKDIEDYLLKVGSSLYHELREKEPEKVRAINPVGYYGIGFLSSFMLLNNGDDFEGSIEIETKRKGYDAVKVLILNPNLPVVKLKSNREDSGTKIKIRCRRKDVREFFENVIEFVKALEDEGKNVRIFPFVEIFGRPFVINSVFEVDGKKLEIKLNVKIDCYEVWNEPIKPDLFIDGEKLTQVEVRDDNDVYRLEVWTGKIYTTFLGLIPIEDLKCMGVKEKGEYVLKTEKKEIEFHVEVLSELTNINGLSCYITTLSFFIVLSESRVNGQEVSYVLTIESSQPNFTDLKKDGIRVDPKVVGKIFNELCKKDIYFDFDLLSLLPPLLKFFIKIGAEDFVKKRLRFKDVCGDWITLKEIENNSKKPLVADIFIEEFYDKFREFFDSRNYHVLSSRYINFFGYSALDVFSEWCNECKHCVFIKSAVKIKNNKFKEIILNEFGNIVATGEKEYISIIVDNPFVKTICKLWKENKIDEDIAGKLYFAIRQLAENKNKGYVTVEDLEKYAEINEEFRKIYELVKNEMDK